ncbi:hypothetical protein GDO78_009778 [Eleutherodactylus coqui]|uniref:Tubulin-specific chaperone E n=1 Tax=Eleutherodactylus coqui TaxID=57060 RepID=A0A8J6K8T3_ELECQ|nr:hypothetical protein GDO78_009778 [Eleutherodactylus coqui]
MTEVLPSDPIGRHIICDGEYATVRYVGEVPPTPGIWLGVEWYNPLRGKHDGSYEGSIYFTCSHPTGGSFIRPKKANFGVSFLTAVTKRYGPGCDWNEAMVIGKKTVELVGFESVQEKQSQLNALLDISIRECMVGDVGQKGELKTNCPNISTLNLSKNLLSSWENVADIALQLEKLKTLDLSENKLSLPSNPSSLASSFTNLVVLSLNRTGIIWNEVLQSAVMWPALEELHLASNNITCLERPINCLQCLTLLDISKNHINDGNQLHAISDLPRRILPQERKGAELDYRKIFGNEWLKSGGNQNSDMNNPSMEFLIEHPRYSELLEKYGALDDAEIKQPQPFALKNQLLTLTIMCPDIPEQKPIKKKLPDSMTVQKVKGLLYRLIKVPGSELKLSYESSKMEGKEIQLENDLKSLQFYSLENGDCVLVRW